MSPVILRLLLQTGVKFQEFDRFLMFVVDFQKMNQNPIDPTKATILLQFRHNTSDLSHHPHCMSVH